MHLILAKGVLLQAYIDRVFETEKDGKGGVQFRGRTGIQFFLKFNEFQFVIPCAK